MNSLCNLIDELKLSKKIFVPSIISEINFFVLNKLLSINEIFKNNSNKYILLSQLANLGLELENITSLKDNNILSIQLNFLDKLFDPIINKIRNICLELNLELVEEYKNIIINLFESEPIKYKEQKKNIKFVQINCFCKNINYNVSKGISFEDFGISIKITNYHFKDTYKDLFICSNLFVHNNNSKDKRFDWFWKAIDYENNLDNINIDLNKNQFSDNENISSKTMYQNEESYDTNEIVESFKIIQKIPGINIGNASNQTTNVSQDFNTIKPSDKEMSKIISNSIIIDDESFTIPINSIDNNDNLTTISSNLQDN